MTRQQALEQLGGMILEDPEGQLEFASTLENKDGKNIFRVRNPETGAEYRITVEIVEVGPDEGQIEWWRNLAISRGEKLKRLSGDSANEKLSDGNQDVSANGPRLPSASASGSAE